MVVVKQQREVSVQVVRSRFKRHDVIIDMLLVRIVE
jgi:hypothetical protein